MTVSVTRLRRARAYVTGFASHPGADSVNSLSTLANAVLQAGGPSAGGSFRSVKLYRDGREIGDFDFYDLLRKGDRSRDPLLKKEGVLFIPPLGQQAEVIGSVNEEAIYELKPGVKRPGNSFVPPNTPLKDVVRMGGGLTPRAYVYVVPPLVQTLGVFGAVYRPASFLLGGEKPLRVRNYVERAGGAIRGADRGDIFVVRANGGVLTNKRGALSARVLAGDTVFVPARSSGGGFWAKLRDISTILLQLGVSAAAIAAINN